MTSQDKKRSSRSRGTHAAEGGWRQEWEDYKYLLERLLVRTGLAAEGEDDILDQALAELRKRLRGTSFNPVSLRALQKTIDQRLVALDERQRGVDATPADTTGSAASVFPGAVGSAGTAANSEAGRGADDEPGPELTSETGERVRYARRVAQLVDHLLGRVSLPSDIEARACKLRDRLAAGLDWNDLREALREVTDLMVAALSREHEEFETFLQRLDDRLAQMHQHMDQQSAASATRRHASETLDGMVGLELQGLGQEMERIEEPEEVAALKQSVNGRVARINRTMKEFRSEEHAREALLEEQLQLTREKLAAVEVHSERMKKALTEERDRALTDSLTQLPNREAWDNRLACEYDRWQRQRYPVMLSVLDIDHFKRINDDYGHKAGDRVLQLVSRTLAESVRETDFIARYGGEEFVLLMPETDPEEARRVVENLRRQITRLPFHFGGNPVSVSFSAGIAPFTPDSSADQAFDAADRALYKAKEQGRNRVLLVTK